MADRYGNGQTKQGMDLPPSEGDGGFVGDAESAPVGMKIISGKQGYVNSQPIWSEQSSGDAGGDALPDFNKAGVDSTDEQADYKSVKEANGMPVTYRTTEDYDGAPAVTSAPKSTTKVPSVPDDSAGEHEMALPQTSYTHENAGGAPLFKFNK